MIGANCCLLVVEERSNIIGTMNTTEEIVAALNAIKSLATIGQKHIKGFHDYITKNLNEHCHFIDEDVNPNCVDVSIYGLHLRTRVEIGYEGGRVKSAEIKAYLVSCDGKIETLIYTLPYDTRMRIYDEGAKTEIPADMYPRLIFGKIFGEGGKALFKPC